MRKTNLALFIALIMTASAFALPQTGSFRDNRDGKTYKTVVIGTRVWMAENLAYNAKGSACYDNKNENCAKYGRLYNFEMAQERKLRQVRASLQLRDGDKGMPCRLAPARK